MNSLFKAVALIVSAPIAVFAQSTQPLTRADVRNQLVQIEKAGYDPSRPDPYYPKNLQAAEARVAAGQEANTSIGGSGGASSEAGPRGAPAFNPQPSPKTGH
jgi:hypothetical protein